MQNFAMEGNNEVKRKNNNKQNPLKHKRKISDEQTI